MVKNVCHSFAEPKVMSSNYLFFPIDAPKPKNIQTTLKSIKSCAASLALCCPRLVYQHIIYCSL